MATGPAHRASQERDRVWDLAWHAPAAMLSEADRLVGERLAEARVDVLLIDYRRAVLISARHPDTAPAGLEDSAPGRVFATQQPLVVTSDARSTSYTPITVWGERLGVLATATQDPLGQEAQGWLVDLSSRLGLAITAAGHHTDWVRRAQRRQRLSLAAELQWQLFPGAGCDGPGFAVAGQVEPAYQIAGDNFDWDVEDRTLALSVSDGVGRGSRRPCSPPSP